jgi:hypothetical protein
VSGELDMLREFVGSVWPDEDFADQSGVLVLARTTREARAIAREAFGDGFGL